MNLSGTDIASQSVKEISNQKDISDQQEQAYQKTFDKIFPNVKKGDRISAHYAPGKGVSFYLNEEKLIGQIDDLEDSKNFLNIWLGDKTSDPDLREELLN